MESAEFRSVWAQWRVRRQFQLHVSVPLLLPTCGQGPRRGGLAQLWPSCSAEMRRTPAAVNGPRVRVQGLRKPPGEEGGPGGEARGPAGGAPPP